EGSKPRHDHRRRSPQPFSSRRLVADLRDSRKHHDQERGDGTEEKREKPPQQAATAFGLGKASIYEGQRAPADKPLRLFVHSRFPLNSLFGGGKNFLDS